MLLFSGFAFTPSSPKSPPPLMGQIQAKPLTATQREERLRRKGRWPTTAKKHGLPPLSLFRLTRPSCRSRRGSSQECPRGFWGRRPPDSQCTGAQAAQHRVQTQAFSPVVRIGPLTRKRVLPPFGSRFQGRGANSLARGGGWSQFGRRDRHSGTLGIV